jgi:hypothetical protein
VIAVYEDPQAVKPSHLMWLGWTDGRISFIRDYKYVRYVIDNAELAFAVGNGRENALRRRKADPSGTITRRGPPWPDWSSG